MSRFGVNCFLSAFDVVYCTPSVSSAAFRVFSLHFSLFFIVHCMDNITTYMYKNTSFFGLFSYFFLFAYTIYENKHKNTSFLLYFLLFSSSFYIPTWYGMFWSIETNSAHIRFILCWAFSNMGHCFRFLIVMQYLLMVS